MSYVLDPDGSPTPIYYPDDPAIQEEDRQERLYKSQKRIVESEEQLAEDIRFNRLPDWRKLYELGIAVPGVDNLDYPERDYGEN